MTEDEPDWTETIRLGDGPRASGRRQAALVVGILVVSIALLVGLVAAGAALFRTASDRAHSSRSYAYGRDTVAPKVGDLGSSTSEDDRQEVCSLLLTQHRPPSWVAVNEAIRGCADALA